MKHPTQIFPERLYSLDVTRGIASLSIVMWHWKHFFYTGTRLLNFDAAAQPFYPILKLFYERGDLAVDYFFVLSGFIFYWLYSDKIAEKITFNKFFVLRFSRLYPLHFATLLIVLVLQWFYRIRTGSFFIYPHNDLYHFLLNLLFASNWGIQLGHSFNGPVWSVSIEVLCYGIFFIVCALKVKKIGGALILALAGILVDHFLRSKLGRGVEGFFLGGCVFLFAQKLLSFGFKGTRLYLLCSSCFIAWLIVFFRMEIYFPARLSIVGLFCLTILCLVLVESQRGHLGKRLSFLGDISYSSYLLHFPLQLFLACSFLLIGGDMGWFLEPISLVVFYLLLVPLSLACYRRFEHPAQVFIREKLSRP